MSVAAACLWFLLADPAVAAVLDDWHAAAAAADYERYFSHFAPDAVFMGTDASERWPIGEFRVWAKPFFDRGRAWSFTAVRRNVVVRGGVAWFDEELATPNLGPCRGSGVLVETEAGWKIAHYNLALPVPNDMVRDLVSMVAGEIPAPSKAPLEVDVMSFNVGGVTAESVLDLLRKHAPDVVGLQEVARAQFSDLDRALPRYARVGGAGAILYDRERFRQAGEGTFWFSDTPCIWVRLVDRSTGREIAVYNVDLDLGVPVLVTGAVNAAANEGHLQDSFSSVFPDRVAARAGSVFAPAAATVLGAAMVGDRREAVVVRLRIP